MLMKAASHHQSRLKQSHYCHGPILFPQSSDSMMEYNGNGRFWEIEGIEECLQWDNSEYGEWGDDANNVVRVEGSKLSVGFICGKRKSTMMVQLGRDGSPSMEPSHLRITIFIHVH